MGQGVRRYQGDPAGEKGEETSGKQGDTPHVVRDTVNRTFLYKRFIEGYLQLGQLLQNDHEDQVGQ